MKQFHFYRKIRKIFCDYKVTGYNEVDNKALSFIEFWIETKDKVFPEQDTYLDFDTLSKFAALFGDSRPKSIVVTGGDIGGEGNPKNAIAVLADKIVFPKPKKKRKQQCPTCI